MRAVLTEPFAASLIASPREVQKAFGKQLTNLLRDLRHPSLRAKKYEERIGLWQAPDQRRLAYVLQHRGRRLRAASDHASPQVARRPPTEVGVANALSASVVGRSSLLAMSVITTNCIPISAAPDDPTRT
jgi:hypothetical protein